jgi:MinD-like ATPase involved in chromosome partitioning or flagellar assembly/CheY-like chemotaxis protein
MRTSACILLVEINRADASRIQAALCAGQNASFAVQSIEQPATALARLSGGGVDLVVLNISVGGPNRPEKLSTFRRLRAEEPQAAVLILTGREDETHAAQAVREGAMGYVVQDDNPGGLLLRAVHAALENTHSRFFQPAAARGANPPGGKPAEAGGRVISFCGVKGGVGTTTVALNTAAALASRGSAIVAQLAPGCALLRHYFYNQPRGVSQISLFERENQAIDEAVVARALLKAAAVPQLRALPGPLTAIEGEAIHPEWARGLIRALGALADYVVVDLGCQVSEASVELIECSDFVGLVLERDPIASGSAERLLTTLEQEGAYQKVSGMVVVNRSPRDVPMELSELGRRLAAPIIAVISPAVELSIAAYQARKPLVALDPESLVANCIQDLARAAAADSSAAGVVSGGRPVRWQAASRVPMMA